MRAVKMACLKKQMNFSYFININTMISVVRLSEISRFRKTRARELSVYDFQNKRQPHHRKPSYSLRPCRFPAGISNKKLELSSNSCKLWRHFILTSNDHARWLCLPLVNVNINFFSQAMRLWNMVRNFSGWVTLDKNISTIAWIFQLQWYYMNLHTHRNIIGCPASSAVIDCLKSMKFFSSSLFQ